MMFLVIDCSFPEVCIYLWLDCSCLLEFVDWLAELAFFYVNPGSNYQRKKTVLLLFSAVLETCTDTWSPEKKKGQPPGL